MEYNGYTTQTMNTVTEEDIRTIELSGLTYASDSTGNPHIYYKNNEITGYLKAGAHIDQASSILSINDEIRKALLEVQRTIAQQHDLIADGRDVGSVVFPQADFKFYLTAPVDVRAMRWMRDQHARGTLIKLEDAVRQLCVRDERDMNRSVAPLKIPDGATVIDNEAYTLEETVVIMYNIVKGSCL
jgi:cytidylate kinase